MAFRVWGRRALILETERLMLREAELSDARFMLELLNSPGFLENIGDRGVRDEAGAAAFIESRLRASYREHGFGLWIVVQKAGRKPVGLAGLVRRDGLDMPDVGYAFIPAAWGQGYAQEAAAAVLAQARTAFGLPRLAAITKPDNYASMAVLKKIGFTQHGLIQLPGVEGESTYFIAE